MSALRRYRIEYIDGSSETVKGHRFYTLDGVLEVHEKTHVLGQNVHRFLLSRVKSWHEELPE